MSHQQHWDDLSKLSVIQIDELRHGLKRIDDVRALASLSEAAEILAASITGIRRLAIELDRDLAIEAARHRRGAA